MSIQLFAVDLIVGVVVSLKVRGRHIFLTIDVIELRLRVRELRVEGQLLGRLQVLNLIRCFLFSPVFVQIKVHRPLVEVLGRPAGQLLRDRIDIGLEACVLNILILVDLPQLFLVLFVLLLVLIQILSPM